MFAVSLFIAGCLGLQVLALLNRPIGPLGPPPYLWPFIDYPMYSWPRAEGDTLDRAFVAGILPDTSEVRIEPEDLGLLFFLYQGGPVAALLEADRHRAEFYRDLYVERKKVDLIGLRLKHRPVIVSRNGYRFLPERTVVELYVGAPGTR